MTHTKGPWRLERGEKLINTHALIVHGPDDVGPVAFATPVNGALIAAAPELYDACQLAWETLSEEEWLSPNDLHDIRTVLRAALTKAVQ